MCTHGSKLIDPTHKQFLPFRPTVKPVYSRRCLRGISVAASLEFAPLKHDRSYFNQTSVLAISPCNRSPSRDAQIIDVSTGCLARTIIHCERNCDWDVQPVFIILGIRSSNLDCTIPINGISWLVDWGLVKNQNLSMLRLCIRRRFISYSAIWTGNSFGSFPRVSPLNSRNEKAESINLLLILASDVSALPTAKRFSLA
jgi:hypothetical protein